MVKNSEELNHQIDYTPLIKKLDVEFIFNSFVTYHPKFTFITDDIV